MKKPPQQSKPEPYAPAADGKIHSPAPETVGKPAEEAQKLREAEAERMRRAKEDHPVQH